MKRIPPYMKRDYMIKKFFPLLWTKCDICQNEFLFTKMWYIFIRNITYLTGGSLGVFPINHIDYVCFDCIKTKEEAIIYREKRRDEIKNNH